MAYFKIHLPTLWVNGETSKFNDLGVSMEKFIIEGGIQLRGTVTPSGNKNAALPILAACLLTDEPVTIHNLPRIRDVEDMLALLASVGVEIRESARTMLWCTRAMCAPPNSTAKFARASARPFSLRDRCSRAWARFVYRHLGAM